MAIKLNNRSSAAASFSCGATLVTTLIKDPSVLFLKIESINKNHATIVYLLKNATSYFKQDEDLNFRYENCKSLFESHHSPIMDMTRREILRLYVKLDSQYDMLIKHNEELQEENTQLKKTIEELDLSKNY